MTSGRISFRVWTSGTGKEAETMDRTRVPAFVLSVVAMAAAACPLRPPVAGSGTPAAGDGKRNGRTAGPGRAGPRGSEGRVAWHRVLGADPRGLSAAQRRRAVRLMKRVHVYFGCSGTVLQCLESDPACHTARRLAGFILRIIARGKPDSYVHRQVRMRAISLRREHREKLATVGA